MSTNHWELISKSDAANSVIGIYRGSKEIPIGNQTWFMSGIERNQDLKLTRVNYVTN